MFKTLQTRLKQREVDSIAAVLFGLLAFTWVAFVGFQVEAQEGGYILHTETPETQWDIELHTQPVEVELTIEKDNVYTAALKKEAERPRWEVKRAYQSQVTVYNSVPSQTDGDPWTTASGTRARPGVIAANCLPFGTKIRIPEHFGDQIFTVEDRLHPRKSCYIIDVWQEYSPDAYAFGAPVTTVEIVEESMNREPETHVVSLIGSRDTDS